MPLVILIWVYIIWIVIQRRRYIQQQKEDEMWKRIGEQIDREKTEKEKLKNSYTIDD